MGYTEWLDCMRRLGQSTVFSSLQPAGCSEALKHSEMLLATTLLSTALKDEAGRSKRTTTVGAYKVYYSSMTHRGVRQVSAALTLGPQSCRTMMYFTAQSGTKNAKGRAVLPFVQLFVTRD